MCVGGENDNVYISSYSKDAREDTEQGMGFDSGEVPCTVRLNEMKRLKYC